MHQVVAGENEAVDVRPSQNDHVATDSEGVRTPPARVASHLLQPVPNLPPLDDAAAQVARLQADLHDVKTMLDQLKMQQQIQPGRTQDQVPRPNTSDSQMASMADVMAFARSIDSLVWLTTRPGSARRDEAVFTQANLAHLARRVAASEQAIRSERL